MNHFDLQELLDRELKRLPAPRAPRSLLPRVLAATVQGPAAAPRRGWRAWPRAWQAGALAILAALAAGGWMAWPMLQALNPGGWPLVSTPPRVAGALQSAGEAAAVVRILWQVVLQPVATWVAALTIAVTLACGLLWTALERFALGGASQR